MSTVLYRKYRPQLFKEITNQRHIVVTLQHELITGRLAHAYCFNGPRGVGKTTTARILARAINCTARAQDSAEPCNACQSCLQMTADQSLDLIEVDAASHNGVDTIRENIIAVSRVATSGAKKKIFIIDEVHMLSINAFNALLKTLEEPPDHVVFIMATTELHKVPPTILSRCQRFDFQRIRAEDLAVRLKDLVRREGKSMPDEVIMTIALRAEGSVRDAESVCGQILSLDDKEITLEQAQLVLPRSYEHEVIQCARKILARELSAALQLIEELLENGGEAERFFDELVGFFRSLFLAHIFGKPGDSTMSEERQKVLLELAGQWNEPELRRAIDVLLYRRLTFKTAPIESLPIELAISEILTPSEPPPVTSASQAVGELFAKK